MNYKKYLLTSFIIISIFYISFNFINSVKNNTTYFISSVFFQKSVDTDELIDKYDRANNKRKRIENEKIKIMIVPGHDNKNSGAQFYSIKESQLNLYVANKLDRFFAKEKEIESFVTRDKNGYNPEIEKYLSENSEEISNFVQEKKRIMRELINDEKIYSYINVHHNTARPEVVGILYGINKYANDNNFDIIIHIHFNDYPGRTGYHGKYNGFSIYVPEKQYSNAEASFDLAVKIRDQLARIFAVSNMPQESAITEDQELIAVGAFNTSDPISILIEYGYIYERQFTDPDVQRDILTEMAYQTYLGVINYLGDKDDLGETFGSFKRYKWNEILFKGSKGKSVLALQDFLNDNGYYPINKNLNECPLNGNFGECTEKSLKEFQNDHDLKSTGILDKDTIELINNY